MALHHSTHDRRSATSVLAGRLLPFRLEQPPKLSERPDVNRVSPFRKGIGRFATAPVYSPCRSLLVPSPDRRSVGPACPEAEHVPLRVGLRLSPRLALRHARKGKAAAARLQPTLGWLCHTWCGWRRHRDEARVSTRARPARRSRAPPPRAGRASRSGAAGSARGARTAPGG